MRNSRSRHRLLKALVIVLVLGLGAAAATPLIIWFEQSLRTGRPVFDPGPGGLVFQKRTAAGDERVLTLNIDKSVWIADKDLKSKLNCFAAFQRDKDWLAVAIQDFGTRAPRQGELVSGAIERLQVLFPEPNLSINSDSIEPAKIGGLDALKTMFKGTEKNNVTNFGEVYMVPHHGFAYWVFIASRAGNEEPALALAAELDANSAIKFTTERHGWTEQPPRKDTFTAHSGAYNIETPEKVWRSSDPKTADDKHGDLFLAGLFRSLPGQNKEETPLVKNATLLGVSLDRKADLEEAYKDALTYFEKLWREQNKDYSFIPMKDGGSLSSEEISLGPITGRVGQARLKRGDEKVRYMQIAVFNDAQKTHALQFECMLPHRDVWQREFQDVLKTVKLNTEK